MLVKFESKSNRVKGLSFHPKRPWILASLHNGVIQLWDYRMEVKIDQFEEHEGPVRGVHFHPTQPLFVSGGDDYKIKVWNYQQRRCLFNLLGHLDYIRTVQFHHEQPWILSASDDQTISIWNWQSRTRLAVLAGHNHYVMCAQWHPREDLVLSASLDQTVRVWDISGLRKKSASMSGGGADYPGSSSTNQTADLFGGSDVSVRHLLEGHVRGVNWAAFHRSLSLIVSGADDREVKLWRMNDTKAWEVDTFRGHVNNVSSVIFHPKKELIISNSEDKTIRVWDMSKATAPLVYRKEQDRYWILDAHPTLNLLAAGHDSGLTVFKLNKERPAYESHRQLYFYRDSYIYEYNFGTGKERPIATTRRRGGIPGSNEQGPRYLHYNASNRTHHCVLLVYEPEFYYDLYVFPREADNKTTSADGEQVASRGVGRCCVWVSRDRFAVLDKARQIYIRTLKNEVKKKLTLPNPNIFVCSIYPGGVGRILIRTPEAVLLYDINAMKVTAELPTQVRHPIKYCSWSGDHKYVALYSKSTIFIANAQLEELCSVNENGRIKSGSWDPVGVFLYTTSTHIKYLLPNGDGGIVRTLDAPVYITAGSSTALCYIDREVKTGKIAIDATEYLFKVALSKKKHKEVLRLMQSRKLIGQSIIAYLQKKGFPDVALHFVQDDSTKFTLALECGDIKTAQDCAEKLDTRECWNKLAQEALRQGNHQVVEKAYQKMKNYERLSFLYLITGNVERLSKMLQIAQLRKEPMARFHNALYLGNAAERVQILRESGQTKLAYVCAKVHGLEETAAQIAEELGDQVPTNLPDPSKAKLLFPPTPILRENNWPLLSTTSTFSFDNPEDHPDEPETKTPGAEVDDSNDAPDWDDSDLTFITGGKSEKKAVAKKSETKDLLGDGSQWGELDIDLGVDAEPDNKEDSGDSAAGEYFVMPSQGRSAQQRWSSSPLAADLAAAGSFDLAMHMLHRQIGVVNFAPLKDKLLSIYSSSHALLPQLPSSESLLTPILRPNGESKLEGMPDLPYKLAHCVEMLTEGYKAVTGADFKRALEQFVGILHTLPVVVIEKKSQQPEIDELLTICREYTTAMRLELARKDGDPNRQAALAVYFTHCKIQPMHQILGLKLAIKCCFQIKNLKTTAGLCRRLLELSLQSSNPNVAKLVNPKQITQVLQQCEKVNTDAVPIDYDEPIPFQLCAESFSPIYKGKPSVRCPYCSSVYKPEYDGKLCSTCNLSKIGAEASGLQSGPA